MAGPLLSLAHLTVIDAHPLELIDAAAAGQFDAIGLRIVPPMRTDTIVPVIGDEELLRRIEVRLADTGIELLDVEAIWLGPDSDVGRLEPALAVAQRLGAGNVLVVGNDPDTARVTDNFAALAELAGRHQLKVGLEFIPYCQTSTVQGAQSIVKASGQPNAGVLVDALHLVRSGGGPDDVRRLEPHSILYGQICDAHAERPPTTEALRHEARGGRLYPGQGRLPLAEILDALPGGLPLGVEAPCPDYGHLPVVERGRICGAITRQFLDRRRRGGARPIAGRPPLD